MGQKLKTFGTKHKVEIFIFLAVFGVRFLYSFVVLQGFGQDAFVSYLDAEVFVREANNILAHGVMSQFLAPPFLPDPLRTPLYLWFLALFLKLGFSLFGIALIQSALMGAVGVFLYKTSQRVFKDGAPGLFAALLFAFEPGSVYWSNMLMSDILFVFLFIAAVFLFVSKRWYLAVALLGLATLTRPLGLYLFPLFFLMTAVNYFHASFAGVRERALSTGFAPLLKRLLIMSVIFALIVSPWAVRNKILFGRFELSTAGWLNFYIFSVKEFAARRGLSFVMPSPPAEYYPAGPYREVFYNYEFESERFFKERTGDIIRRFPVAYPLFHAFSGLQGIHNHDYRYLFEYVIKAKFPSVSDSAGARAVRIGNGFWWVIYGATALGLFYRGRRHWQLFFVGLILWNAVLIGYNGVISSGGRYQLPFLPLLLLLGCFGMVQVYRQCRRRLCESTLPPAPAGGAPSL